MLRSEAARLLGLPESATDDEVKASHRLAVRLVHPDTVATASVSAQEGANHLLVQLNDARAVLLSDDSRGSPSSPGAGTWKPTSEPSPPPPATASPPYDSADSAGVVRQWMFVAGAVLLFLVIFSVLS